MTDDQPDLYSLLGVHALPQPLVHGMHANTFNEAMTHLQQGRTTEAKQLCAHLLAQDPDQSDILHGLGLIAMQEKAYTEALDYFQRAEKGQPKNVTLQLNLGQLCLITRQYGLAARSYQKALHLLNAFVTLSGDHVPDVADKTALHIAAAQFGLGQALGYLGHYQDALQALEAAIAQPDQLTKGDLALAWMHRGMALGALEKHDEAKPCFERAIVLDSALTQAHFGLGNACYWLGEHAAAERHLKRTLKLEADHVPTIFLLATLLHEAQREEEALPYFERAATLAPELRQPHASTRNQVSA